MKDLNKFKPFAKGLPAKEVGKNLNTVIYTRVSTKEQAENRMSLETQLKACKAFADKSGYQIIGLFGGTHESAKTDDRKEFKRMMDFVRLKKNRVSSIIVYSLDRFSRSGVKGATIAEELRTEGINVISCTQLADTNTSAGMLQQNIQFVFSHFENQQRREKCMAGMVEKLRKGYWVSSFPKGYEKDLTSPEEQKLVINETGKAIKEAFMMKAYDNLPISEITQRLHILGFDIPEKTLYGIFKNPFYCGLLSHSLLNGEVLPGKHPPLISEEVFLKANSITPDQIQERPVETTDSRFPLRRFIKCAVCGTHWVGYSVAGKKATYYKCNRRGCRSNRNAGHMHQGFAEFLSEYSVEPAYIDPLKAQLKLTFQNMNQANAQRAKEYSGRMTEIKKNLDRMEERFVLGEISEELYQKFRVKYQTEINEAEDQLAKAREGLSNLDDFIDFSVEFSSRLAPAWITSDDTMKRKIQYLVFPEGVKYDNSTSSYRTSRVNALIELMATKPMPKEETERGPLTQAPNYSELVVPPRIELGSRV